MTFRQRLQLFTRAAVGLFSEQATQAAWGLLSGVYSGSIGPAPARGTRERLEAFADLPWLHAVADRVATAFSAVEWQLFVAKRGTDRARRMKVWQRAPALQRRAYLRAAKQAGELQPIENHLLLDVLSDANEFQTGEQFRRIVMLQYDLSGDAFLLKERNGLGAPVALWPIPPHWILSTPTPSERTYRVGFRGWHGTIPDAEFVWINNPNPAFPYGRGVGMAQALADELESDEYASKHIKHTFLNQARPDFLVYPKGGDMAGGLPQVTRLQEEWRAQHQGFWRVAKPKFLTREVGVYEFGEPAHFRNMTLVPLRESLRDCIRQVWGVPPVVLGIIEPGQSRATVSVEKAVFAEFTLIPRLEMFRSVFQERLIPEYDDRLILDYVSPIEEDSESRAAAAAVAPWALTVDEWRARMGLLPLEAKAGEVFLVPTQLQAVEDLREAPPGSAPADDQDDEEPPKGLARLTADELLDLRRLVGKAQGR